LEHVGIQELARKPYRDLSGGQKQRVLIARALCGDPTVLVLDEPTNDMDLGSERAVMDLIRHLHDEHQITTIVVSHLLNVVANYVKRIAFVDEVRFQIAPLEEVLTSDHLSQLYGRRVQVGELYGRRVVL
jgi:ABC-type cobalamin/Fe3+-siderophores transport system ATPase subunit